MVKLSKDDLGFSLDLPTQQTALASVDLSTDRATDLEYSFRLGIDFENRRISLLGEIVPEMFGVFDSAISVFEKEPKKPVRLSITSPGGDLVTASAIISRMRLAKQESGLLIDTRGLGDISSAAFLILAAGTRTREIAREASAMFHAVSYTMEGKHGENRALSKEIERLIDFWCGWLEERTKETKDFWLKVTEHPTDTFYSPLELVELGVVDAIV